MSAVSLPFQNSYAALPERFFVRKNPDPVKAPALVRFNTGLCELLGLDEKTLSGDRGAQIFSGNTVPDGAEPISMAYAGHQFGGWVPQLGDGRAILLGEIVGTDGIRRDIQLKGSGRTHFSRGGDGRAAVGPVLREYIVSEAMHTLGVPTTRALAVTTTGEDVIREGLIPGAVLTRVAQSHVRIGTFQYFAARNDTDAVKALADYVIARHYPDVAGADNPYPTLLSNVVKAQASLVSKWFGLGFIHGVMNTDNTSVIGETIDYGPCAFMDTYHPATVFSSIDSMGRYAFSNQPSVLQWNLAQMAQALLPLLDADHKKAVDTAQAEIDTYPQVLEGALADEFRGKLGLMIRGDDDLALAFDLLEHMAENRADFTITFRHLADIITDDADEAPVRAQFTDSDGFDHSQGVSGDRNTGAQFTDSDGFDHWVSRWQKRLKRETRSPNACADAMRQKNPAVIPRNHRVEAAIRAAEDNGDFSIFHELLKQVTDPYRSHAPGSHYVIPPKPDEIVHQTFCGT